MFKTKFQSFISLRLAKPSLRACEAMFTQKRRCERSEAIPKSRKRNVVNNVNFSDQGIASQTRNDKL